MLPYWERALRECCLKNVYIFMYFFSPGAYVGTLDLIASIPGPSILTFFCVLNSVLFVLSV